jgi:hypothetical protein
MDKNEQRADFGFALKIILDMTKIKDTLKE